MHRRLVRLALLFSLVTLIAPSPAEARKRAKPPAKPEPQAAAPARGPTRIDFDDRLIQGQTNAAGSVYLYDRKALELKPMVEKRQSFRTELVATVLGN